MDRIPFTYLIGWSHLDTWYYGVKWSRGCDPSHLWVSYYTSSRHVTDFRKKYGEPDVVQVRRTFEGKHAAQLWESKVLRRFKVEKNPRFLNKKYNSYEDNHCDHSGTRWFNDGKISVRLDDCPDGFVPGRLSFKRTPHSESHRRKISIGNKGKKISAETRKKHSEYSRKNRWFNDGSVSKFCEVCPEGFSPGRIGGWKRAPRN